MKATIIAVGTELTTGQITNRNAAWIADRLQPYGIEVVSHVTVPDEEGAIWQAFERGSRDADLLVVTGGLGPTSDDFTRDVVAKWVGVDLEYDEASWKKIEDRLTRMGVPIAESNRQQCYYPEGAEIFLNDQGTANGFGVKRGTTLLWVFPGPPRELEAAWMSSILPKLENGEVGGVRRRLVRLGCMGKSEAQLGEIVDQVLEGSELEYGFRAHAPYVEVKVWVNEDDWSWKEGYVLRLETALAPWLIQRDGEDFAETLVQLALPRFDRVRIEDLSTLGLIAERIARVLQEKSPDDAARFQFWIGGGEPPRSSESSGPLNTLVLRAGEEGDDGIWELALQAGKRTAASVEKTPYPKMVRTPRSRRYIAELALKKCVDFLRALPREAEAPHEP